LVGDKTPFVGRDVELRQLDDLLGRGDGGIGTLVLLSGEAGIGKTRLCSELRRMHGRRGGSTLLGRSSIDDASVPFAPLADTLRASRRTEPRLWDAARSRAAVLGPVAPELASDSQQGVRPVDRRVLFEALIDAIEEAAGDRTTLWTIEDIQWADDSTWEFIRYSSRRIGDLALVLLVTYREEDIGPGHPWWAGLLRLRSEASVQGLRLTRIPASDGERLARAVAPSLSRELVVKVIERAAGTPLLVEELATLASKSGRVPTVPDVVQATVRERADRLSQTSRSLLEAAAVIGLEIEPVLLSRLHTGGRPSDLVAAGLLVEDDSRLVFRHPLMHEAVYSDIPHDRRLALHKQLADALAGGAERPVALVAAHLERAAQPLDALNELLGAADEATRHGNVDRGATWRFEAYRLAVRHQSLADKRVQLQALAIRDLFAVGRWSELAPVIGEALPLRRRLDPRSRARLAAIAGWSLYWGGAIHEATALLEGELAELEKMRELDSAAELLTVAGTVAWWANSDGPAARRLLRRAVETAQRSGEVETETRARCTEVMVRYGQEREADIAAHQLRKAIDFADAHGQAVAGGLARLYLAFVTWTLDEAQAAIAFSAATGAWFGSSAILVAAWLHLIEGRRPEAEAILGRSRAELRLSAPTLAVVANAIEACLFLHRGDLDEARQLLSGPSASNTASHEGWFAAQWSAAMGWLAWEELRWAEVATHLAACAQQCAAGNNVTMGGRPIFLPLHVDALVRLGQPADAYRAIESSARVFAGERSAQGDAAVAAARFRLQPTSLTAGEADRLASNAQWPWLQSVVGCWRGELLNDANAAEQARHTFDRIGARRGAQRADRVLRRLGVRQTTGTDASSSLSARELEVAELVAEGLSNPAIARRLYLSRSTVATHVAHILTKLDFSSRAEIAAWIGERRRQAP